MYERRKSCLGNGEYVTTDFDETKVLNSYLASVFTEDKGGTEEEFSP